ncbi:hypothetical protein E2C01_077308 [Portunus trituberculatus]|uniref:Uncharacterized protein n=1 Tax=Portunus trituberculatus TaxID=210409 RepID=A0A5B7IK06_PORTR|nr:hypothetical protein [Portunus trituberculatus]
MIVNTESPVIFSGSHYSPRLQIHTSVNAPNTHRDTDPFTSSQQQLSLKENGENVIYQSQGDGETQIQARGGSRVVTWSLLPCFLARSVQPSLYTIG